MLCERCKAREANIHYTEVVNGVATEHNLCSQCAKEMDLGAGIAGITGIAGIAGILDSEMPIGKLLSQLLGLSGAAEANLPEEVEALVCPTCQTSYGDFVKNSQFGCPDCYHMFDLLIGDKLKQLHGSDSHKGKTPTGYVLATDGGETAQETNTSSLFDKPLTSEERISLLRSKLQEAIGEEDYEAAAGYRDEIRSLEKMLQEEHAAHQNEGDRQ